MTSYKIYRWNVVLFGNSNTKVPMIYIKPDLELLEFIKANSYVVASTINDTGTIYDGKTIPGIVNVSCNVPNCRPNFCAKTGLYVITLWANWYGYPEPDKLGNVNFSGMKLPTIPILPILPILPTEQEKPMKNNRTRFVNQKALTLKQYGIVFGILIFLLIMYILYKEYLTRTI